MPRPPLPWEYGPGASHKIGSFRQSQRCQPTFQPARAGHLLIFTRLQSPVPFHLRLRTEQSRVYAIAIRVPGHTALADTFGFACLVQQNERVSQATVYSSCTLQYVLLQLMCSNTDIDDCVVLEAEIYFHSKHCTLVELRMQKQFWIVFYGQHCSITGYAGSAQSMNPSTPYPEISRLRP